MENVCCRVVKLFPFSIFIFFYICVNIRLFNSIIHNKNHNKTYFFFSSFLLLLDASMLSIYLSMMGDVYDKYTKTHNILYRIVFLTLLLLLFFCYQLKIKIKMVEYCFSYVFLIPLPLFFFFSLHCYE